MSERDFTRSVRGLGPNHKKADCNHGARIYRRLTDIEVSEATNNCRIGFIEILVFNISFSINNYLVFLTPHLHGEVSSTAVKKDNQNDTGAVGKGNVAADILGAVGFGSQISAFRKDFKIRGAIGEAGHKDILSDISLLKQIEEGKDKSYSDKEIVNAVIKAITPELYLRNVLETIDNVTLDRLMKFLQSHFVDRNSLVLSQHLTSLTQGQQESATKFICRTMSLRQKLVLASKSLAPEISYDEHLAQKLFLKAVETDLSSESILSEIKPLLRDPATSDEDLIFAVGQASSADSQRLSKISKVKGS